MPTPTLRLSEKQWVRYHAGLAGEVTRRFAARRERLILDHLVMVERIARKVAQLLRPGIPQLDLSDLVQDGRLGLVQAADRYRSADGAFDRFAYRRVRGAMLDAHKRNAWREHQHCQLYSDYLDNDIDYLIDPAPGPHELAIERERGRRLGRAVAGLPAEERQILERTLAGEVAREVAASYGRQRSWTDVRVRRARAKVTASLNGRPWPHGVTHEQPQGV